MLTQELNRTGTGLDFNLHLYTKAELSLMFSLQYVLHPKERASFEKAMVCLVVHVVRLRNCDIKCQREFHLVL